MKPDDDLARELARRLADIPVPEGLERRVAAAARDAARAAGARDRRRRWRRRRVAALAAAAAVAGAGGTAAGYWLAADGDGGTVPASPAARAAIRESPLLARAPWLTQPGGGPPIAATAPAPSLAFPRGTSYAAALDQLLRSVLERGQVPAAAAVQAALPAGVVWAAGDATRPPRLDLRAPWGYDLGDGRIRPPSFTIAATAPDAEVRAIVRALAERRTTGRPLSRALRTGVPALAPCQVWLPGERNATCPVAAATG